MPVKGNRSAPKELKEEELVWAGCPKVSAQSRMELHAVTQTSFQDGWDQGTETAVAGMEMFWKALF